MASNMTYESLVIYSKLHCNHNIITIIYIYQLISKSSILYVYMRICVHTTSHFVGPSLTRVQSHIQPPRSHPFRSRGSSAAIPAGGLGWELTIRRSNEHNGNFTMKSSFKTIRHGENGGLTNKSTDL